MASKTRGVVHTIGGAWLQPSWWYMVVAWNPHFAFKKSRRSSIHFRALRYTVLYNATTVVPSLLNGFHTQSLFKTIKLLATLSNSGCSCSCQGPLATKSLSSNSYGPIICIKRMIDLDNMEISEISELVGGFFPPIWKMIVKLGIFPK